MNQVYVSVVDVKKTLEGAHMIDITIETDHPDVHVVTQVTNITSGTNLA